MEPIVLALIALVPSVITPLLTMWLLDRNQERAKLSDAAIKAAEKKLDYARQDEVAARLVQQQQAAVQKVAEVAEALREENKSVAETAKSTNDKLDIIHVLVNSQMTAAMQGELNALGVGLRGLLEIIELKKANGLQPTEDALAEVEATKLKVAELEAKLADRLKQAKVVEKI